MRPEPAAARGQSRIVIRCELQRKDQRVAEEREQKDRDTRTRYAEQVSKRAFPNGTKRQRTPLSNSWNLFRDELGEEEYWRPALLARGAKGDTIERIA
jgi:hypothetical protein